MIRLATLFWLVLVSAAGFAMFAVKYQVQSLEDELNRAKKDNIAEEHAIRMDEVEWAYLTRPEILQEMNQRHLSLMPIGTTQLHISLADIPLRPSLPVEEAVGSAAPSAESAPAAAIMASPPAQAAQAPVPTPETRQQVAAAALPQAPEIIKPVAAKAVTKPPAPRRPKTLDDLIAQIATSR
jgi:hypothetical protein